MKTFYSIAFLEGEGLGTAYEYYVKKRFLEKIIKKTISPKNICIYGLPQNHGLSMDFVLLASDYGSSVTLIEEKDEKINRFKDTLDILEKDKIISNLNVEITKNIICDVKDKFDLLLNIEVLQKYSDEERNDVIEKVMEISKTAVFFLPNSDNINRIRVKGSKDIIFSKFICEVKNKYEIINYGYLDMPPFPSGLCLSSTNKGKMKESKGFISLVFLVLKGWSLLEAAMPSFIKKNFAHVSYAVIKRK